MLGIQNFNGRNQFEYITLDEMVPKDHLLRKIDIIIDFDFIYDLVINLYDANNGRPSLDPVLLIKLPMIQYLFGIRSMRQTIKEIEVNLAYRWFLGLSLTDSVPHFTTFGKNFKRRFKGTDLFDQIFKEILNQCIEAKLVDPSILFVDGTHVKASANNRKHHNEMIEKDVVFYKEKLDIEIDNQR